MSARAEKIHAGHHRGRSWSTVAHPQGPAVVPVPQRQHPHRDHHQVERLLLQPGLVHELAVAVPRHEVMQRRAHLLHRLAARQLGALRGGHRRVLGDPPGDQRGVVAADGAQVEGLHRAELGVAQRARRGHQHVGHVRRVLAPQRPVLGAGDGARAGLGLPLRVGGRVRLGLGVVLADEGAEVRARHGAVQVGREVHPAEVVEPRAAHPGLAEEALRVGPVAHQLARPLPLEHEAHREGRFDEARGPRALDHRGRGAVGAHRRAGGHRQLHRRAALTALDVGARGGAHRTISPR